MGTTTNYALRYPAATASPNVPVDMKNLADDVDAALDGVDDRLDLVEANRARGLVKYGAVTTASGVSTSSTAVGVMRLDSISLLSGRAYLISCPAMHPTSTVTTDVMRVEVRGSTSGTATTASAVIPGLQAYALFGQPMSLETVYQPGSNQTLSLILCIARDSGSGNVTMLADTSGRLSQIIVTDIGLAVSNSAVDL